MVLVVVVSVTAQVVTAVVAIVINKSRETKKMPRAYSVSGVMFITLSSPCNLNSSGRSVV